jgi:hypothetical protein
VDRLCAQPPLDAGVPADFEDRFTLTGQVASEPGAVVAGALDCPGTNATLVLLREAERVGVPAYARSHNRLGQDSSRGSNNDRERVPIAVRVDTIT